MYVKVYVNGSVCHVSYLILLIFIKSVSIVFNLLSACITISQVIRLTREHIHMYGTSG